MKQFYHGINIDHIVRIGVYDGSRTSDGFRTEIEMSNGKSRIFTKEWPDVVAEIESIRSQNTINQNDWVSRIEERAFRAMSDLSEAESELKRVNAERATLPEFAGDPGKTLITLVKEFCDSGKQYPGKAWKEAAMAAIEGLK